MKKRIVVFGATGRIGRELLTLLSKAGIATVAVTRDDTKATSAPNILWKVADMNVKESLTNVMQKDDVVFLLSNVGQNFIEQQYNVASVGKQLGIAHIVKLSSGAADAQSKLLIPRAHGLAEDFIIASGLSYTILRSNGMMQNWLGEVAESVRNNRLFHESTRNGRRAYVDIRDIAEVAFHVLTEPGRHANKTYLLTGDVAVDYDDVADTIANVIHEAVRYIPVGLEEARTQMIAQGMPMPLVETFLEYDRDQAEGRAEFVTTHVRDILNKPARSLHDFVTDYRQHFI